MENKIFKSLSAIGIITIITLNLFCSFFMHQSLLLSQKESIKTEFSHLSSNLVTSQENYIDTLKRTITPTRLTLINTEGTVIFDNFETPEKMENHLNREEIIGALENGTAQATRSSKTLGKQTYYFAQKLDENNILRLSFTSDGLYSMIISSVPLMLFFSVIYGLILWLISKKITKKIIEPIDLENGDIYEELEPFTRKIKEQKQKIYKEKAKLSQKISEFNLITENIADGLIVINKSGEIISLNDKAKKIFKNTDTDFVYRNFLELTRSIEIKKAVDNAQNGENTEIILELDTKIYKFHISPITVNSVTNGVFMLIINITNSHKSEKIRREFSANVSHELKTPLTSISGYAELIKSGLVKPDDIKPFAENIHIEATRLIDLIENIIKVSKLDEGDKNVDFVEVSVADAINSVVARLDDKAKISDIIVKTSLDDAQIKVIPHILDETLYNLVENAIKYNNPNGTVNISAKKGENFYKITISDTGIGIKPESIDRIFERFYRADTSHSNKVKGSGLGLSIVKHSVLLLGGEITVSSDENVGSTFTLQFPIKHIDIT